MSNGRFVDSRYESNSGRVYACRVQPETLTLTLGEVANAATEEDIDQEVSATISQGKRSAGMNMRSVTLEWVDAAPAGYDARGVIRLPILTADLFDSLNRGDTGTYLNNAVRVAGLSPETRN